MSNAKTPMVSVLIPVRDGERYLAACLRSVLDENMRIHVATFDAAGGEAYNRGNCEQAQALFQAQPGVKTKFWCEKGRFRG